MNKNSEIIYVTVARKLTEKERELIKSKFDSKAQIEEKIDTSIIGGIIIKYKESLFDGSISTQLNNLKSTIVK